MLVFSVKKFICLFVLICALTCIGCSNRASIKVTHGLVGSFSEHARVFQKEKLAQGGNLLVVPFSAGENVESSNELDRVSLMIVKGIADVLAAQNQPFKFMVREDAQKADFVIKGRIVQVQEQNKSIQLWQRKIRKLSLQAQATILEVESEQVMAKFSLVKEAKDQEKDFDALGYRIGEEIGRFLLTTVSD